MNRYLYVAVTMFPWDIANIRDIRDIPRNTIYPARWEAVSLNGIDASNDSVLRKYLSNKAAKYIEPWLQGKKVLLGDMSFYDGDLLKRQNPVLKGLKAISTICSNPVSTQCPCPKWYVTAVLACEETIAAIPNELKNNFPEGRVGAERAMGTNGAERI